MKLNFALCTDENFVVPALVCMTSIFENNADNDCVVYVLTEGLTLEAQSKFQQLSDTYNQQIVIKKIDLSIFDSLITRGRYRLSMYFRFLLPEILLQEKSVLYLDCDIIVRHSLESLFLMDISKFACGVVVDQQCDDVLIINRLKLTSPYFNSGVMLMNLDYWREHGICRELIEFIGHNPDICIYPDQDALNVVLSDKVLYLDYTYNYQEMWLTKRDEVRFHFSKMNELLKVGEDPAIVHFCVDEKPWYIECNNPYKDEFLHFANMHKFIGFAIKKRYSWIWLCLDAKIWRMKRLQKKFIK